MVTSAVNRQGIS